MCVCDAGEDTCVCLAVAMHLACFQACTNDAGIQHFVQPYKGRAHKPGTRLLMPDGTSVTKHSIRRVLAIISRLYPLARPTRGNLKQVFNFFEPPRDVMATVAAASGSVPATAAASKAKSHAEHDKAANAPDAQKSCTACTLNLPFVSKTEGLEQPSFSF